MTMTTDNAIAANYTFKPTYYDGNTAGYPNWQYVPQHDYGYIPDYVYPETPYQKRVLQETFSTPVVQYFPDPKLQQEIEALKAKQVEMEKEIAALKDLNDKLDRLLQAAEKIEEKLPKKEEKPAEDLIQEQIKECWDKTYRDLDFLTISGTSYIPDVLCDNQGVTLSSSNPTFDYVDEINPVIH